MEKLNRRSKHISYWDLITFVGEKYCFVCGKKFKEKKQKKIYIGKTPRGESLYRHNYCNPLSENWRKKFK